MNHPAAQPKLSIVPKVKDPKAPAAEPRAQPPVWVDLRPEFLAEFHAIVEACEVINGCVMAFDVTQAALGVDGLQRSRDLHDAAALARECEDERLAEKLMTRAHACEKTYHQMLVGMRLRGLKRPKGTIAAVGANSGPTDQGWGDAL